MGWGAEFPFLIALGFLVLGPKRVQAILGQLAKTKAEFDKASRSLKSQLTAGLGGAPPTSSQEKSRSCERDE